MTEHDRLWQGILDEPDEDGPRLVFADWLDDNGEPERAEFIRAQVELARLDEADPRYPELLTRWRRAATFTTAPAVPWRDHIPGASVAFRRGTIARATLSDRDYLKHSTDHWQQIPLEDLVLWRSDRKGNLAARPELSRLRRLALADNWEITQARPLLAAPSLAGVRDLFLGGLYSENADWELLAELAETLAMPNLEGLCWEHAPAEDWPTFVLGLGPLRRLAIETYSGSELPDEAAGPDQLLGSPHWPTLRRLGFYHHINTIGYGSVYDTPPLPDLASTLATLPVEDLRLSIQNLPELAALPTWGNLHTLRLGHADLTDDLAPLAGASQARQLRRLLLDYPDGPEPMLGEAQPDVLASPHLANLRHLRIDGYYLSDEDMDGVAAGHFREGLVRLEFYRSAAGLTKAQVARLLAHPWPQLRTLRLPLANRQALAPVLTTPHLPELCTLIITGYPRLTTAHWRNLARAPGLPHLSLGVEGENEWLLSGGTARKVARSIWLLDRDLYEAGLYKSL